MRWLTVAYSMTAAASLTLAAVHVDRSWFIMAVMVLRGKESQPAYA
jgi:hypothetical protein